MRKVYLQGGTPSDCLDDCAFALRRLSVSERKWIASAAMRAPRLKMSGQSKYACGALQDEI